MLGFIGGACKIRFIGQPCGDDPQPPEEGVMWDNSVTWDNGTYWS